VEYLKIDHSLSSVQITFADWSTSKANYCCFDPSSVINLRRATVVGERTWSVCCFRLDISTWDNSARACTFSEIGSAAIDGGSFVGCGNAIEAVDSGSYVHSDDMLP